MLIGKKFLRKIKISQLEEGFTLAELLVTIAVIGIVSGVVVLNYRTVQNKQALQRSTYKLAQDIRRTQEMAMSAQKSKVTGVIPKGGFGIWIDFDPADEEDSLKYFGRKSYIIYADDEDEKYNKDQDYIEEGPISFESGVEIESIEFVGAPSPATEKVGINFKPPDPNIVISKGGTSSFNLVQITLRLNDGSSDTRIIEVNKFGLIDIITP